MAQRTIRNQLFNLHKWIGFFGALYFGLMFLTGLILVLSDEIDGVLNPEIFVTPVSGDANVQFGDIYASVSEAFPQAHIYVIERQPQPWLGDRSFVTSGSGEKLVVWTDPETTEVLGVTPAENFRAFIHDLHDSLLVPRRIAFIIVSSTSLVLLTALITGLISYRRFWRGIFRKPSRQSGAHAYQGSWHRLLAVWSVTFLLIIALTGVFFIFTGLGINGYTPNLPKTEARESVLPAGFGSASINDANDLASAEIDGFKADTFLLPDRNTDGLVFEGYTAKHGNLSGPTRIAIDPVAHAVLGKVLPPETGGTARLKPLMNALHFGQWAGIPSRIIWSVFGIMSIYLIVRGVKVFMARTASPATASGSSLGRFVRALGIFKWAYLAFFLGLIALAVLRFGPGSTKWTGLPPTGSGDDLVALQIYGTMRSDDEMSLRISLKDISPDSVEIQFPGEPDRAAISLAKGGAPWQLALPVHAEMNQIDITLITGTDREQVNYNLGAPIW